jgi:DUF218 domain
MNSRCALVLVTLLFGPAVLSAEKQAAGPARAPLLLTAPVQDKNFFLLSLFERTRAVSNAIGSDAELKDVLRVKRDALHNAATVCKADIDCLTANLRFTEEEILRTANALRRLYRTDPALREMADGALRDSGSYVRYQAKEGDALLAAAWLDAANSINHIIDVYGRGVAPRYPDIDSLAFDVKSQGYAQLLHTVADSLDEQSSGHVLFFQPSLRFALYLLRVNRRDEAGRHEPLESGENAATLRHIHTIAWKDFPYTVIVVPGFGPDRMVWDLSPQGRLRVEIAARRYKDGQAPLILVSGGYVHPNQTVYCEAIEMKKSLIDDYGVPADSIIVEPHARHTTTNLRNAARLMYRYGIPFERKALITTDRFQSEYIASEAFAERCNRELGYQPAAIIGHRSPLDLEFTPRVESLQIDSMDPLDP